MSLRTPLGPHQGACANGALRPSAHPDHPSSPTGGSPRTLVRPGSRGRRGPGSCPGPAATPSSIWTECGPKRGEPRTA